MKKYKEFYDIGYDINSCESFLEYLMETPENPDRYNKKGKVAETKKQLKALKVKLEKVTEEIEKEKSNVKWDNYYANEKRNIY